MPRFSALITATVAGCGGGAAPALAFDRIIVDPAFRAEGVAVFDVDGDGDRDVVTDQYWYEAPELTPHEVRAPEVYDPNGYSKSVGIWGQDVDSDGWIDLVVAPFPTDAMYWYANPQGGVSHWIPHEVAPALSAGMESPIFVDVFATGRRVMIMGVEAEGLLAWFEPGGDPTAAWARHPISAPGFSGASRFSHGLGIGDVDGDGRQDVLTTTAWFQQTPDPDAWVTHPIVLGVDPCSTMFARDLDGDRRADLLCAHPHSYGLDWWQQLADGTFAGHPIDTTISQMHALGLADLDGDAVPELITGKNWLAHPTGDPGTEDPAVLAYYTWQPDGANGPRFERHDIDLDSGVGRTVTVEDLDGDAKPDIIVSNKKGLFVFQQR